MKTVFITRQLTEESIFKKQLENEGFKVFGESLINFTAVPLRKVPTVDWIFFYSKNGVKFFFEGINQAGIQVPGDMKWATIGTETASVLTSELRKPDFIGDGNGAQTAKLFLKVAMGQKVLFPQAETSLRSIQKIIESKIETEDLIVYKNVTKEQVTIPTTDYVAFTSPMNVKAYFENRQTNEDQKIIAIGQTTEQALDRLGIKANGVAEYPSEVALAKTILKSLYS